MRRLSAAALTAALLVGSSGVALAESGPKVSGLVLQRYHWNLTQNTPFQVVQQRLRLNVDGQTSRGVSYSLRLQALGGGNLAGAVNPDLYVASATVPLPYGASLTVGRQLINFTILDEIRGMIDQVGAIRPGDDAVLVTGKLGPATVSAGYDFSVRHGVTSAAVAFAKMPLALGGPTASVGLQLMAPANDNLKWGVNGAVSLGAVTPYFEVGTGRITNLAQDYRVIGVKFDVLRQLAGLDALVEYDMATSPGTLFARVGREILPGLWVHLRRETNADLQVRTELSVAF